MRQHLNGSRYRFRVEGDQFFIAESFLTGKEQEHRIEYTLGSRRIQHYLTTIENGRIIVLPPSWDVQRQQWFTTWRSSGLTRTTHKLVQEWNKNCVGCHVSEEDEQLRPGDAFLCDAMEGLRDFVRAVPWSRQRARAAVHSA